MGLVRYLQHWLGGAGPRLQVADFVPDPHPLRQWADTFPWAALVAAVEQSFAPRFPKRSRRGRPPIPIRVLLALELLKHEVGASDEAICARLRTDFAVMYACGLREYQALREQASFVLPETLCEFRSRIDEVLMDELIAIQAAAAMEAGLVSPAHLVVDTFPCEQGSQRVTDATTLYKAQKNANAHRRHHPMLQLPSHSPADARPRSAPRTQKGHAEFWPAMPRARAGLREVSPPNGTPAPRARPADSGAGPASSAAPGGDRDAPRRSTGAVDPAVAQRLGRPGANPQAIGPADPRQEARPL